MQTNNDPQDFAHPKLGREVTAIGGHYVFGKEIRLPYNDREILQGSGFKVHGSGFEVQGSRFKVQGSRSGFRVQGSR